MVNWSPFHLFLCAIFIFLMLWWIGDNVASRCVGWWVRSVVVRGYKACLAARSLIGGHSAPAEEQQRIKLCAHKM